MITFLQWLGFRSKCCNEPFEYHYGWDWKEDGYRCSRCEKPKGEI